MLEPLSSNLKSTSVIQLVNSYWFDLIWLDLTWLDFDLLLLVLAIWTTSWNRANLKIIGWAQLPFVILEIPYSHFRPWIWLGNNLWNNKLKINTDWLTEPLTLNWIECEFSCRFCTHTKYMYIINENVLFSSFDKVKPKFCKGFCSNINWFFNFAPKFCIWFNNKQF